jgi:hypothetical protein
MLPATRKQSQRPVKKNNFPSSVMVGKVDGSIHSKTLVSKSFIMQDPSTPMWMR